MTKVAILELENEPWTREVGPTINDPIATAYSIVPTPEGLCLLMNSEVPYGGWLAKQVSPLICKTRRITFLYTLMIDDATLVAAQVIETDFKITDNEGWTYDLSAQWLVFQQPWMFQVDHEGWSWRDTNVRIAALDPQVPTAIEIEAELDYEAKTSRIVGVKVDDEQYAIEPPYSIPARQEGWAPMEIVTQLQQCNNSKPGGYGLRFSEIGYVFGVYEGI